MNEITYRPMREEDVKRVAELEAICFRTPWSYRSLLGELSNNVAHYIVAVSDNTVVGYAGSWIMFDEVHMTNIAVDPDMRNRGIATNMIIRLMGFAIERGGERMTLEVRENNHRAQRLYASLDFAYAGMRKRYYTDTGENALILWNDHIKETFDKHRKECGLNNQTEDICNA